MTPAVPPGANTHLQLKEGVVGDWSLPAGCHYHVLIASQHLLQQTLQCNLQQLRLPKLGHFLLRGRDLIHAGTPGTAVSTLTVCADRIG